MAVNPFFKKLFIATLLDLSFSLGQGQDLKYTTTFNFNVENDYISIKIRGNDRYYSEGMLLGFTSPVKKKNLFDRISLKRDFHKEIFDYAKSKGCDLWTWLMKSGHESNLWDSCSNHNG